jgi:hypothetical protein
MLVQAIIIAASAAFTSAQVIYNSTTGQFICPANNPNGNFCAGDSLTTNIIIRCNNGIGGPGNCDDNLDGEPPVGLNYAPCWQTSNSSGDAACSKNCIVYSSPSFTLQNCTPSYTASSSTASSTSTASSSSSSSASVSSSTTTSTGTTTYTTGSTTITETFTTTYCPESTSTSSTLSTTYVPPTGTGSTSPPSNGTTTTPGSPGSGSSPTKTPVGPTTTGPSTPGFTGAASSFSHTVGGTLAGIGLIVAYFL